MRGNDETECQIGDGCNVARIVYKRIVYKRIIASTCGGQNAIARDCVIVVFVSLIASLRGLIERLNKAAAKRHFVGPPSERDKHRIVHLPQSL